MWRTALIAGALLALLSSVSAHSFLTVPHPISTMAGCRVGGTGGFIGDCPGPCPNYNLAADADKSNPSVVLQRGSSHRTVWTRNNHEGGFVRWALVPHDKMYDKKWHEKMAFHYNCWNVGRFSCNAFDFHRDCNYDLDNEAYSKMLYIPPIYPDGDYILSWTWYGGGVGSGHFGDYYDCSFVRVEGGAPLEKDWQPDFAAGGGSMYDDGCEATVDDLGICWEEPCLPMRKTAKMVPKQFEDGKQPGKIQSSWFGASKRTLAAPSVRVVSFFLVDAKRDLVVSSDINQILMLNRADELSLLVLTEGDAEYVEWFTNGKRNGRDYAAPYTIAGDFRDDFYPWMHPLFNRRIRVSVKVCAKDGAIAWGSTELRFQETMGEGISRYPGVPWTDLHDALQTALPDQHGEHGTGDDHGEHGGDGSHEENTGADSAAPAPAPPPAPAAAAAPVAPAAVAAPPSEAAPAPAPAAAPATSSTATTGDGTSSQASGGASISTAADEDSASASAAGSGDGSSAVAAADMGSTLGMAQGASFATSKRRGNPGRAGPERPDQLTSDDEMRDATSEFA